MSRPFDDILRELPRQSGNGGRLLSPVGSGDRATVTPLTTIDKTTAAAKLIIDEEAEDRASKTARLKAERESRDRNERS